MKLLTTNITRRLEVLMIALLASAGINANADSHAPPPASAVLEAFFCTYNAGKDRDDLDAATKFYLKQADKAGIAPPDAFVWTHNKGTAPVDLVWLNVHENLVAFGAADDAAVAADEMVAVGERYDSVGDCQDMLGTATAIIAPDPDATRPEGATLATYACKLRRGIGPDALSDLRNHIRAVNENLGEAGLAAAFQIVPMTTGPQSPDVVFVAATDSTEAWAKNLAALNSSPEGQTLVRHFNTIVDCDMNLWWSDQVVGADG